MPPKKQDAPEIKPLIGRVGTNLKVGIVGVPNVSKKSYKFSFRFSIRFSFRSENRLSSTYSPSLLHQLRIFLSAPSIRMKIASPFPTPVSTIFANITSLPGKFLHNSSSQQWNSLNDCRHLINMVIRPVFNRNYRLFRNNSSQLLMKLFLFVAVKTPCDDCVHVWFHLLNRRRGFSLYNHLLKHPSKKEMNTKGGGLIKLRKIMDFFLLKLDNWILDFLSLFSIIKVFPIRKRNKISKQYSERSLNSNFTIIFFNEK